MQTEYFNYAFNVRGKCNIARKFFNNIALSPKYSENDGTPYAKSTSPVFSALIHPLEYSYGNVFIAGNNNGCRPFSIITSGDVVPTKTYPTIFFDNNPTLYDMSGAAFLRGYLQPMTLADYCAAANLKQTATRVYLTAWQNQDSNYAKHLTAVLGADKKVLNEYEEYSGKIVPVITWYYTNADGERVSDRQNISIAYLFSANHSKQGYWKQYNVPLSGGTEWRKVTDTVSYDTILFGVCAPYVSSVTSSNAGKCAPLNGYAYSNKYGNDMRTTIELNETPLYTLLSVGYPATSAATSKSDYFDITGGVFDGKYGANFTNLFDYSAKYIPVFNSVNEIVDMFEDFGVVVTTDWNEVLNPTPTPEETATPNPDPTDREIPNFPDNTTDNTPIEPAYITPSTFGQSCVYTPTTTRDFLTWVCDSTVDIGNWARLFANPADVITGINLYNLDIVAHDTAHVAQKAETNILGVTTPIPNYTILGGYNNIVDGGTLHLQAYYGNYADFTSMTYQMYVPFVGFTTLRACDVVNKTLHLYYAVDFATGSAVAFVNSDNKLIYTSPCTVAGKIPLSTSDRNSQMINNTLSVLGGLSGLLGGIASGNVGGGVGALMGGLGGLQMQTNYSNKGSLSSVNIYKLIPAFIERTRYDLFLPSNDSAYINARYQSYAGAPSTQFDTLLNCVGAGGFVQSDVVYLTSQTATETEKQQIIDLIKSGIYL